MTDELVCHINGRRDKVREAQLGGIDAVETTDDERTLMVTFIGKAPYGVGPANVRIDGGRRVTEINAVRVTVEREADPELDDLMYVTLDRTGDTTRYRLSIVDTDPYDRPGEEPFPGFDQRYFSGEFRFRAGNPTPFDCREEPACDSAETPTPLLIDYTARDYETLRQLLLDRLALTTPDWTERLAPDLGITLIELLAYTGDQLSYQQDAVATEAYLDTARRRMSMRRHVRLIDYRMHDGCNARTYVALETAQDILLEPRTFRFAAVDIRPGGPHDHPTEPGPVITETALGELTEHETVEVFEPVTDAPLPLRRAHNSIRFWTWGEESCTLPCGATSVTLRDEWLRGERMLELRPGDLLVLEEITGTRTGTPGDANPAHRHVVRLTSVLPDVDELVEQPVLEVHWAVADALPFSLCLSTIGGYECEPVPDVSVARGNVVLVDHGRSQTWCGGQPETVTTHPEPAVLGSCEPGFDCSDHVDGNQPAELIEALIDKTRRRTLAAKDVRELHDVLGEPATTRAGIRFENAGRRRQQIVPATAHEQGDALRQLLAQSVYPGIKPRFRPALQRSPVVQAVPFPDPRHISDGQAARLAAIPGRVRERLVALWRSAHESGLDSAEVEELGLLFGDEYAEPLRLRPIATLRELLHGSDELLTTKRRRLEVLTARARAGTILGPDIAWEIACTWGLPYAEGLEPAEPVLHGPASPLLQDPRAALPAVRVTGEDREWTPRRDLLDSGPRDRHFVGELDDDGRLVLRFGDGRYGAQPSAGTQLELHYRLGGGTVGNVGAEAINHLVLCEPESPLPAVRVRNPLAAVGGTEPEPIEQVRQLAPLELRRTRLRAVTTDDYAELASELPGVQRAAAELRWTGSTHHMHVAVDPTGVAQPSRELLAEVADHLQRFRRIGHELVVRPAERVPLDVVLWICAAAGHQRGQIIADLHRMFGRFFHPDSLSFGEPVRLSRLVAAATAMPGVIDARVTRLQRLFHGDAGELDDGLLRVSPLEVACCDNDPEYPENGVFTLDFGGER